MKKSKKDLRWMSQVALMSAIVILLANTPIGMIQLPIIKATTVHIPVIIGAVLLGPSAGAILGAVFGICSIVSNTTAPTLLSFAFSPFLSTTGIIGALKALWTSVVCRIAIGIVSGWLWIGLKKIRIKGSELSDILILPIVGFAGSMTNTVMVLGSIYFMFSSQYAEAKNVAISAVFGLIMTTVASAGIPEAIAAAVLVTAIGKALLIIRRRRSPKTSKTAA
ncbi:MAG: ECF transporter S component [Clostridiales bacterium]|nr:ECF transporter S component [Clostridiales bacterium]